jgi:two-component system sensor histidine kinase FlrB
VSAKVVDSLRHMEGLVNSMLTFVRGGPVVFETIELKGFVAELLTLTEPLVNQAGGVLRADVAPGSGEITLEGDRDELLGAVLNLVNNAIDVSDKTLCLDIKISTVAGLLKIAIADNGPGVEADIRERIFDPFFTTRVKGTGLGLAVVAMTVRSHGGKISLDTRADGATVFCLQLPLSNVGTGQAVADLASHESPQIALFDDLAGLDYAMQSPAFDDEVLGRSMQHVDGGLQ